MAKLKYAFLIGRFQPFHLGHKYLVELGLEEAENVIILVGSANSAPSIKNPWTYDMRADMIKRVFPDANVIVEPINDTDGNDDLWISNVVSTVSKYAGDTQVGIIGFEKDGSSYYLKKFKSAKSILVTESYGTLSATHLRETYFQDAPNFGRDLVDDAVVGFLREFYLTAEFKRLLNEAKWLKEYTASWAQSPFPPVFITCDAVCTQMGKILLVTRGGQPGYGQLALPGGFVEASKGDSFENVLHELHEEAGISDERGKIPRGKLRGFYTGREMRFDAPGRSIRGYSLTTAFRFRFPDAEQHFEVEGGDDAMDAKWYDITWVQDNPQLLFEDHHNIIANMKVW